MSNTDVIKALIATDAVRDMARNIVLSGHPIDEFATEDREPRFEFKIEANGRYQAKGGQVVPGQHLDSVARAVLAIAFIEPNETFEHILDLEKDANDVSKEMIDALMGLSPEQRDEFAVYRLRDLWLR